MTLRSKLFATVALPVLTVSFALSPAMARSQSTGWVVAQAENEAPAAGDDEEQLKKKKAAEEAPAEEPAAPAEEAPAAPAEEAPAAPAEEAPAAPAEEAPAAPAQEAPAAPAEQAPAAPAEEAPAAPAEEAPAAPAEEAPAAPAEEAPAAPAEEAPAKQKEKPAAAEKKSEKGKNKKKDKGKKAAEPKAEEPAAEEAAPASEEPAAPAAEEPAAPAAEEPAAPAAEEPAAPAAENPAAPAAEEPATPAEEQPVQPKAETETPAQPDAATDETQPAADAPAAAEEKPLTQEQKATIAADPSKTTDTVVLPVDNGAAVLDSDKDADPAASQTRSQARQQEEVVAAPKTDADAQAEMPVLETKAVNAAIKEKGEKVSEAPQFAVSGVDPAAAAAGTTTTNNVTNNTVNNTVTNNTVTNNTVVNNNVTQVTVVDQVENTTVLNVGDRIVARSDDRPRLRMDSSESYYEQLSRNRTRETIVRENGSRIVTIYNPYGDVIQRSRISADGDEYVMIYAPEADTEEPRRIYDAGYDLPPMRLTVPVDDYIISTSEEPREDYYTFLEKPPVERVERVYSIDEVKYSARIRDKVRRIDLDTITFATGSAEVPLAQAKTLRKVADAMNKVLKKDPGETFLIEGHTDAVGSDKSNLVLSDQRASSVASLLTDVYGIPPENLTTQGYGERYLKIKTETAEQQNRRVTIRRVTALIRPAAKAK